MIQLNRFQWWFLHQELLKHLNGSFFDPPLPEINYPEGLPPPRFSWMPLRSQMDLTHDSNQSCLQLRSEYVLRITDWLVESGKTQKRAERHHMCRGWKTDTQHLESEVWGGLLPLLREVVRDSSGFGLQGLCEVVKKCSCSLFQLQPFNGALNDGSPRRDTGENKQCATKFEGRTSTILAFLLFFFLKLYSIYVYLLCLTKNRILTF